MESLDQRKQELLDGKRSWNVADAGGDHDIFYSEFVLPLRDLKYAGFFDGLSEHKVNRRGRSDINRLDVLGAINYNAESEG
jgi:hypothetical protein